MANELQPTIDQWYARRDAHDSFRVVAVDEEADAIEIQNFEGDIEELDWESWAELEIDPVDPPDNWTGPFDDLEPDDVDDSESAMRPRVLRSLPARPARPPGEAEEEDE